MKNERSNKNIIQLNDNKELSCFFETEQEQTQRKRTIELISIYLINLFHIVPSDKGLVFLLCGEFQQNNEAALKIWIKNKLSEENISDVDYWHCELERVLSALY